VLSDFRPHLLLPLSCFVLFFAACDPTPPRAPVATEQTATYEVRGVVGKIDAERRSAVIAHEEIPGYMDAMAMEFSAPDAKDFAALEPGAAVSFRLSVTDRRSWIDRVQKIAAATVNAPEMPAPAGLAIGAKIPDQTLLAQDGRQFRLSDLKGRALAITFIFTRCPLPDYCPRMNEQFAIAQRALAGASCHLLSVTIDPAYDTPERLAAYAARFQADSTRWTFATGEADEIAKLANAFGLQTMREGAELNHTLRTVVVDPAGRVQTIFPGNEWKPEELIGAMRRAMEAAEP
jgi:protein SCO1/2